MQKLGFPSIIKSLDQFKSPSGSAKSFSFSSRPSSDSISSGSFANLKLTAEKLVKEQASVKTDLDMANTKLKKSMEQIHVLEEKLQKAFNENAKLKVKQKEDEKLWKGLESKFSSTKTLCDQLTETLQHLAARVQDAEKDKEFFEGKISASSDAVDNLNDKLNSLSLKIGSAEETIRTRDKELEALKTETEKRNKIYAEEQFRTANLIEEKDAMLKQFEATVVANSMATENLNSKLKDLQLKLRTKEDEVKSLMTTQENLEKEKGELQLSGNDFANKLAMSKQELRKLEGFVHELAAQLVELDKQSLTSADKFDLLNSLYDTCFNLAQQEKDLVAKHAQKQYDQLHDKLLCVRLEKDALQLVNQELNDKIIELQKVQETVMAKLSGERHSSGERIKKLESEAEMLISEKNETELLVSKLEETINTLSERSRLSDNRMQDLLLKISALESENKDAAEKMQAEIQRKSEEIDTLQMDRQKHEQHGDSLEKQVGHLHVILEEKEQIIFRYKDREKKLGDQITENQALLSAAESKLSEAKKQYDAMLENKQLELSRHLKDISQRNDQEINDIRKKYEVEKLEIVNMEKEKVDKILLEMERKCDQTLAEYKEESRQQLMRIQDEHAAMVLRLQQEHDKKEMNLKADHTEELRRAEIQSENELREKTMQLRNEHKIQMEALRCGLEDECKKLQEELDLQKSKEDRQRALLQLQWKVMGDNPQDDEDVNSKRDYSVSSIKMRDAGGGKRSQNALESPFPGELESPVSKLLKKVENTKTGSAMSIPKHHKKVTRHEYEVETTNGTTITKRRKTKSTVLFEDPRKHKRTTPKIKTPRSIVKDARKQKKATPKAMSPSALKAFSHMGKQVPLSPGTKGGSKKYPSNIGDLFSEGSLNPYADDPYAFD